MFCSPLLATTGAASVPQMRRFSLQFCEVEYQKQSVEICSHTSSTFSLHDYVRECFRHQPVYIRKSHVFSTIGGDGIRQGGSEAAILAAVLRNRIPKTSYVEHFSHKSSTFSLHDYVHDCFEHGHENGLEAKSNA